MSIDIARLRELALTYAAELPYAVVLDREQRATILEANRHLTALRDQRSELSEDDGSAKSAKQSYGDASPYLLIDAQIEKAQRELDTAVEAAKPNTLTLIFGRVRPEAFAELRDSMRLEDSNGPDWTAVGRELLKRTYRGTEAADGTRVEITWDEWLAGEALDFRDLDDLEGLIITHHATGSTIPFDPRSYGRPATS